jgi:hypothetical protein
VYISLPSFQIQTPVSAVGLSNTKSIVHAINVRLGDYISESQFYDNEVLFIPPPNVFDSLTTFRIRVNYLPPLHQYVEINNDAITPVNDLQISLLDKSGNLNSNVSTFGTTDETCILIFELETEPEKVQEALREVKSRLRIEKFLKNHEYRLPL